MKALMYGGGNIGRGFIGPLFSQSGYDVSFIDISEELVDELNRRGEYPLRILGARGYEDRLIGNVCAINGNNGEAAATAIAEADIMATAVGVNVLQYIVPNLVQGIKKRFAITSKALNIIICENLLDADKILAAMIKEHLNEKEQKLFDERIGLVEASIGRMVPVQTEEMKAGDALRVCAESYGWLPVDKDAFKGSIPKIENMLPYSPFGYYIKRKLFIHNMGHAMCAYLGLYFGYEYIWQAIDDADILIMVKNAMQESARALVMEYDMPLQPLLLHIDDLLLRFKNDALGDTCLRVGSDPRRKLGENDRLMGAAKLCVKHNIMPYNIASGIAAAVFRCLHQEKACQCRENCEEILISTGGLIDNMPLLNEIASSYEAYASGTRAKQLRAIIEEKLVLNRQEVI